MAPSPRDVVEDLYRRMQAGDGDAAMDELVAEDMVNHAAGPQGRDGLRAILATIETDIGPVEIDHHHLVAEGELVAHHMTMRGRHRASTMPLLTGTPVTDREVTWTFIHLWRVVDGRVVEHTAVRDDLGLLAQLGAWPPR